MVFPKIPSLLPDVIYAFKSFLSNLDLRKEYAWESPIISKKGKDGQSQPYNTAPHILGIRQLGRF
jgi:hypothetical protein